MEEKARGTRGGCMKLSDEIKAKVNALIQEAKE
jgi:hypothetical protein